MYIYTVCVFILLLSYYYYYYYLFLYVVLICFVYLFIFSIYLPIFFILFCYLSIYLYCLHLNKYIQVYIKKKKMFVGRCQCKNNSWSYNKKSVTVYLTVCHGVWHASPFEQRSLSSASFFNVPSHETSGQRVVLGKIFVKHYPLYPRLIRDHHLNEL